MAEYDLACGRPNCGHARRLHVNVEPLGVHAGTCSASGCVCPAFVAEAQNGASTRYNALPEANAGAGRVQTPAPAEAVQPPATRAARLEQLVREAIDIVEGGGEVDAREWHRTAIAELAVAEPLRRQAEPHDCADCGTSTRLWSRLPGSDAYRCPACMRKHLRALTSGDTNR